MCNTSECRGACGQSGVLACAAALALSACSEESGGPTPGLPQGGGDAPTTSAGPTIPSGMPVDAPKVANPVRKPTEAVVDTMSQG